MAILTVAAQLEQVQTALTKLMSAQSYMMGETRVTRADLEFLNERERYLRAQYNRSRGNGGRIRINMSDGV